MAAQAQDVARKGVIVPDKTTLVRDAYNAARELGGPLATFTETIGDLNALNDAKGNYVLAVDPNGLPKKEGWYRVERADKVEYIPISKTDAETLRRKGRLYDVLYVSNSAVKAAEEGRPVVLYVYIWDRYLGAGGWPDDDARVALSSQAVPQANAVPAGLLRRAQEQLSNFKKTARSDATDAIEEVLRRVA